MNYVISEHDGCTTLRAGDSVIGTPFYSCCLIVMRMESGTVYAEHCAGTMLDRLSPAFFSETAVEALMVTSRASESPETAGPHPPAAASGHRSRILRERPGQRIRTPSDGRKRRLSASGTDRNLPFRRVLKFRLP